MFKCSTCKEVKNIEEFSKSELKKAQEGYSVRCRTCSNLSGRKAYFKDQSKSILRARGYREKNPDAGRNAKFKYKYGITLSEYDELCRKIDNKCEICGLEETTKNGNSKGEMRLSVDHNHKTGAVRGLLCFTCNVGLGHLKDDVEILYNAIKYLNERGSKND